MSARITPGTVLRLTVESPAAGGASIARHEGQVVFVDDALPGEQVLAQVLPGGKARFLRARTTEVLSASAHRVPDRRKQFVAAADQGAELFGGMEYAQADAAYSRELKAHVLGDHLRRIAHCDLTVPVQHVPTTGAQEQWRTRVQLSVNDHGQLGMQAARSHRIIPVTTIPLAGARIHALELTTLHLPGVRRVEIAAGADGGAVIMRGRPAPEVVARVLDRVREHEGWSVLVADSRTQRNRGQQSGLRLVHGQAVVDERVSGVQRTFQVAADGFWQVHQQAASVLSSAVVDALTDVSTPVADLYCGVGLFSVAIGERLGLPTIGVEGARQAITCATGNSAGLAAEFHCGRVEDIELNDVQAAVVDPPRAGLQPAARQWIADSQINRLVYVSCDQATFARDLAELRQAGFELTNLQAYDLFPLTAHCETLAVLQR